MSATITSCVFSAVADHRTRNLRYRQRQLLSLHKWNRKNLAELRSSIGFDDGFSATETDYVIALALDSIRVNYDSLDLKKELDIEFRIKNGQGNEERKLPEEIVYIIPDNFTQYSSVMSALCASIAAGSCCIVEVPNDVQRTSGLIRRMISESLDNLAFGSTSMRPRDNFLKQCLVIDQQNSISLVSAKRLVGSQAAVGAVAVVDRTADLDRAAKVIATSTRLFGGKGPYTPSCILVNEFVEKQFSHLYEQYYLAVVESGPESGPLIANAYERKGTTPVSGARFAKLTNRDEINVERKGNIRSPELVAVSSLDDAIDLVSANVLRPLLASYIFAGAKSAKYLAQFIRADASFVNHIPANLLVGPVAPSGYPASAIARYRREMFETPSPQFVHCSSGTTSVEEFASKHHFRASNLLTASLQPLKPTGQAREGDVNFFVQAFRASLALYIFPTAVVALCLVGYSARVACRHWG